MEAQQQWRTSARADNGAVDPGSTPHSSAHPLPVCVLSPGFISWGGGEEGADTAYRTVAAWQRSCTLMSAPGGSGGTA